MQTVREKVIVIRAICTSWLNVLSHCSHVVVVVQGDKARVTIYVVGYKSHESNCICSSAITLPIDQFISFSHQKLTQSYDCHFTHTGE